MIVCNSVCKYRGKGFCENENYSVMYATARIILDTRRMKIRTGKYPLKLQVSFQRVTQRYQTIFELSAVNYNKLNAPRISADLQSIKEKIREIEKAASDFIDELDVFSFYQFERDFIAHHELFKPRKNLKEPEEEQPAPAPHEFDFSPYEKRFSIFREDHSRPGSISIVFFSYIKRLIEEQRIGTALSYQDAYNSFRKFRGNVLFTDITVSYLHQYEHHMRKKGTSKTTIGIKVRALRAMFNEAIEMGIIKKDKCYPFGRRRYQIPSGRNIKKALGIEQIKSLYYYEPECPNERKAKDFWLFCYFGNGMNPKDIVYLKYKDMHGDFLVFIRAKTEHTTRTDPKPISVYVNEDMRRIIEQWGNKDRRPDNYIFPIMEPGLNPLQEYKRVTAFTRFINDRMIEIGKKLGLEKKPTTIVSRHSFSTQLKRSGVSTEFIQEALGHTDKKTTENYLDSFEQETKKRFSRHLIAFKQIQEEPVTENAG